MRLLQTLLKMKGAAMDLRDKNHPQPEIAEQLRRGPAESQTPGRHDEKVPSPGKGVHARIARSHKGDVGRPGTNEEIFQGSRQKEIAR